LTGEKKWLKKNNRWRKVMAGEKKWLEKNNR
jgi:hypothetical protein